jgi:hypothetical protein
VIIRNISKSSHSGEYESILSTLFPFYKSKVKVSRYHHAGDKGEKRYSFYSLLTSALDGCEWSVSFPARAVPIGLEAGLTSEVVWTQRLEEKFFASARNRIPVVQSIVQHYID